MRIVSSTALLLLLSAPSWADDPKTPLPVPVGRPQIKQALEDAKKSKPRLPVPDPTDEERSAGRIVNNGRMRQLLLPSDLREGRGGFGRESDPNMSLSYQFKTQLFWIVSRANNCYYCLGHQEIKLTSTGMTDDQIAALDVNWSEFTPAQRAAFAFARKLTYEPHAVTDEDVAGLRKHYTDLQTLEIIFTVAGNNATNRWTGSLAIPPEPDGTGMLRFGGETKGEYKTFLRPTSDRFKDAVSIVAPLGEVTKGDRTGRPAAAKRPALENAAAVEMALAGCQKRTPLLPLVEDDKARALLPADWPKEALPEWVRLLADFPKHGVARAVSLRQAETKGNLSPRLKALVAWVSARHDRAWYALGHARLRLINLGMKEGAIYAAEKGEGLSDAEKRAVDFAAKLSARPFDVCDDDFTQLRKHYKDAEVAELIYHTGNAVFFNRLTEAARLRLEDR
jgi:alkylhydroperoxidase family enzyme